MLKRLTVSNLAVVERAEARFASGLTVITGETGAGKSVLMGALDLVLGGRADATIVRDGAQEAEVEADFGDMVVRRTITAQGRSRAWVNDESVSVAELRELAAARVDIHGPRANQRLLEETFQRETLDAFGAIDTSAYVAAYQQYAQCRRALSELSGEVSEDELDMLRYQVNELEGASLTEDDEQIAARHAAAAHAEEVVNCANEITDGIGGDRSAVEMLIALQPKFHAMARHLPAAVEWAAQADEITLRLQELSRAVADAVSRLEGGDEDMAELDRRLTLVNGLKRKFRADSVAALMQVLRAKRQRLDDLENRGVRRAELERALDVASAQVQTKGKAVSAKRRPAAERLARAITQELHDLGFAQAKFHVALESTEEPSASGLDRVTYMFEPNPGEAARPLAAIASSGEIARVMLAIKTVTAKAGGAVGSPDALTLVFDEIDANIGGEVGRIVGEKMRSVATAHQVIAITHLPQCAVYGERHLVVSKSVSGGRTRTQIVSVEGDVRVSEIARMLGGEKLTSVVRKHAEELLGISR